jgi:hypothetical protein
LGIRNNRSQVEILCERLKYENLFSHRVNILSGVICRNKKPKQEMPEPKKRDRWEGEVKEL